MLSRRNCVKHSLQCVWGMLKYGNNVLHIWMQVSSSKQAYVLPSELLTQEFRGKFFKAIQIKKITWVIFVNLGVSLTRYKLVVHKEL